jgi:antitoxin HigA-1
MEANQRIQPPIHPGELLREEFLEPLGLTPENLAEDTGVSVSHIYEIIDGKRPINAETALRLSRYFDMSERFWMNVQVHYDLMVAKDRTGGTIEQEVKPRT